FVVLERADHRPDIVAGDRMTAVAAAAPAEHVGEGLVLRRAIDDVDRSGGGEDPAAYLEGSEMGGEQDGAASAGERLAQVLETLDAGYRLQPRRRPPPRGRDFQQRDAQADEMAVEEPPALRCVELRQAQLDVAAGDAHEPQRQPPQNAAESGADDELRGERQEAQQAQQAETGPGGPVTWREQSSPALRPRGRGGKRSGAVVHGTPGRTGGDLCLAA